MRLMLFTDTLGDVNGVSRFIRNLGHESLRAGREMLIATSTRFGVPPERCFANLPPRLAMPMPRYPQLELVLPPAAGLRDLARRFAPDVVHVSTPGPVGRVGRAIARARGLPLAGVYHTDFPAYLEALFHDEVYGEVTAAVMRRFYRPFDLILSRSERYMDALGAMGLPRGRMARLLPGIALDDFGPANRRADAWAPWGLPADAVAVLYVGRVSTEKNLPALARQWPAVRRAVAAGGADARLVVVGGGPYLEEMRAALAPHGAVFPGFKSGAELARLYASADVFVFPSLTDTLGQVVLEAQASGVPVVVADSGGPKEVVDDGRTGLVLPAEDDAAWIEAIAALCLERERRRAMGERAARWARGFTFSASFEAFWRAHEALLPQAPHAPHAPHDPHGAPAAAPGTAGRPG